MTRLFNAEHLEYCEQFFNCTCTKKIDSLTLFGYSQGNTLIKPSSVDLIFQVNVDVISSCCCFFIVNKTP